MWKSKETDKQSNRKENKPVYELELKNYLEKGIFELTESLDFDSYPPFLMNLILGYVMNR